MASDYRVRILAGVAAMLGGGFAFLLALIYWGLDCAMESYSECSTPGLVQFVIAGIGLVPAFASFVLALAGRGRPLRWFVGAVVVYGVWLLFVLAWFA